MDDFFGIENTEEEGNDVLIWLFPLIKGEEIHHQEGPFDAIKIHYDLIRNTPEVQFLFEKVFNVLRENLDADIVFNDQIIQDFSPVQTYIQEAIRYCKEVLNVEPGSDQALELDY